MKIKRGYTLQQIAGQWIVTAQEGKSTPVFCLSASAALLWKALTHRHRGERELTELLLGEYRVDEATARADVETFLGQLETRGLVE